MMQEAAFKHPLYGPVLTNGRDGNKPVPGLYYYSKFTLQVGTHAIDSCSCFFKKKEKKSPQSLLRKPAFQREHTCTCRGTVHPHKSYLMLFTVCENRCVPRWVAMPIHFSVEDFALPHHDYTLLFPSL